MTYRIDISIPALQDAESAFLWIRDFNLQSAKTWYEGLLEAIFSLEQSPHRCPVAPESKFIGREIKQLFYGKKINLIESSLKLWKMKRLSESIEFGTVREIG